MVTETRGDLLFRSTLDEKLRTASDIARQAKCTSTICRETKATDIELRENPEKRLLWIIAEKLDVAEIAQPDIA